MMANPADQDERLNLLSSSIGRQNHLSIQIGSELDLHHDLLEDTDAAMDRTAARLGRARRRLDTVAHEAKQYGASQMPSSSYSHADLQEAPSPSSCSSSSCSFSSSSSRRSTPPDRLLCTATSCKPCNILTHIVHQNPVFTSAQDPTSAPRRLLARLPTYQHVHPDHPSSILTLSASFLYCSTSLAS